MSLEEIYAVAQKQDGAIRYEQARVLAKPQSIRRWIQQGRLLRVNSKVLLLPFAAESWDQQVRVACWSFPRAALFGEAAARWWGLAVFANCRRVALLAPRECRSRPTLVSTRFTAADIAFRERRGVAVTSIEQTILDTAGLVHPAKLKVAVSEVFHKRLTTLARLTREIEAAPAKYRGVTALRKELACRTLQDERLRSHFENKILNLILKRGLPSPEADYLLSHEKGEYFADFCWPDLKIVV